MGRRYRNTEQRADEQCDGSCHICRKALIFFQLDHIHADGFDDLLAADRRSDRHDDGTKQHDPYRHFDRTAFSASV